MILVDTSAWVEYVRGNQCRESRRGHPDLIDQHRRQTVGRSPAGNIAPVENNTVKRLSALHAFLFRATGGRIGRRLVNNDMLLLTTTGTKSATPHTVPLLYLRDGERYVIIASWGGRPTNPQWYRNLLAHPEATIQILSKKIDITARTANTQERARLWPRVIAAYHAYAEYESRTTREIPVVILTHR